MGEPFFRLPRSSFSKNGPSRSSRRGRVSTPIVPNEETARVAEVLGRPLSTRFRLPRRTPESAGEGGQPGSRLRPCGPQTVETRADPRPPARNRTQDLFPASRRQLRPRRGAPASYGQSLAGLTCRGPITDGRSPPSSPLNR